MHRITALAAVVAAGAVAASPAAAASPIESRIDRADRFELETPLPKHGPEGHTQDALWRTVLPGPPTWPVDPEPLPRAAASVPAKDADDGGGWLLAGLGLTGAGIAAGGAAGLARRYRIRARRLAV